VALSSLAGTAVADPAADGPANATADAETETLNSGELYWSATTLQFSAPADAGEEYVLYQVRYTDEGSELEFATEVSLDSAGNATLDTDADIITPSTYVLTDGDGNAVVFADGTASTTVDRANVTEAAFDVRVQALFTQFDDPATPAGGDTTLSLTSTRSAYTLTVGSEDLSDAQLRSMFGATTFDIDRTDADLNVTVPDVADGQYDIEFTVADTGTTDRVTLQVDSDPAVTDPTQPDPETYTPLDSGLHWTGQRLVADFGSDAAGETVVLREVSGTEAGAFVTEVSLNDTGVGVVETGSFPVDPGTYALIDNGDALVFDDGSVVDRIGGSDVSDAVVTVREQHVDASFEPADGDNETRTLRIASTRAGYTLELDSFDMSDERLRSVFGTTTLSVDGTDATVTADFSNVSDGAHEIIVSVVDTDAAASAGVTVGDAPVVSGTDTSLSSDETYWVGQRLGVTGTVNQDTTFALYRDGDFVAEVPLDEDYHGVLDTGESFVGPGEYVLRNGDGEAVVLEDGSVARTVDDGNVSEATFSVREQALSASIGVVDLGPGENLTLPITSTRASYELTVSSADLSTAQLRETFGATSFEVNATDATRTVTVPDGSEANVDVTLNVTDADASTTVTFSIADWDFGGEPADPDSDGRLEDVDGNGDTDLFDVLEYFNNGESDLIQTNVDAFDFDDDGDAGDLFDALALWNEIAQ
jgi:hypothetical protein